MKITSSSKKCNKTVMISNLGFWSNLQLHNSGYTCIYIYIYRNPRYFEKLTTIGVVKASLDLTGKYPDTNKGKI